MNYQLYGCENKLIRKEPSFCSWQVIQVDRRVKDRIDPQKDLRGGSGYTHTGKSSRKACVCSPIWKSSIHQSVLVVLRLSSFCFSPKIKISLNFRSRIESLAILGSAKVPLYRCDFGLRVTLDFRIEVWLGIERFYVRSDGHVIAALSYGELWSR